MPVNCIKVFLALALVDRFLAAGDASAVFSYSANVTTVVGLNATVTWSFELKGVVAVQFSDDQEIIMIVRSSDGSVVLTSYYSNSPFFEKIMWKGNLSEGRASFCLTNVTREMFGPVMLSVFTSNQSHANTVYLRVLEYPNKPTTNCGSVRKIDERSLLNCSCAVMGGFPLPVVYWVSPAGDRKGSELVVRNISRNQSGNYTCIALNEAGNRTVNVKVEVQYLDYNCSAQFVDGRIVLKTSATGRPPVTCHPRPCPSRIDLTVERSTSWAQVIDNGLIRHSCNITKAVYDARMKCPGDGRSLELNFTWFSYAIRDDKNTMTFFSDVGGNATMKGLLYVNGMLKYRDNKTFDLNPDDDPRARKFFETACRLKGNGGQSTKLLGGAVAGIVVGVAILVIVIV